MAEEFAATALDEDVWEGRERPLQQRLSDAARSLATRMAGSQAADKPGLVVVNPSAFPRRVELDDVRLHQPPLDQSPVYAADVAQLPAASDRRSAHLWEPPCWPTPPPTPAAGGPRHRWPRRTCCEMNSSRPTSTRAPAGCGP